MVDNYISVGRLTCVDDDQDAIAAATWNYVTNLISSQSEFDIRFAGSHGLDPTTTENIYVAYENKYRREFKTYSNTVVLNLTFNENPKCWPYNWKGHKSLANKRHCFNVYIYYWITDLLGQLSVTLINSFSSPTFTTPSKRRAKTCKNIVNETGKRSIVAKEEESKQLRTPTIPMSTLTLNCDFEISSIQTELTSATDFMSSSSLASPDPFFQLSPFASYGIFKISRDHKVNKNHRNIDGRSRRFRSRVLDDIINEDVDSGIQSPNININDGGMIVDNALIDENPLLAAFDFDHKNDDVFTTNDSYEDLLSVYSDLGSMSSEILQTYRHFQENNSNDTIFPSDHFRDVIKNIEVAELSHEEADRLLQELETLKAKVSKQLNQPC